MGRRNRPRMSRGTKNRIFHQELTGRNWCTRLMADIKKQEAKPQADLSQVTKKK